MPKAAPHPASFKALLQHRRTLLLQGPMGPFFARLAGYLQDHGQQVFKVNFNGGDRLFYPGRGSVTYRGTQVAWAGWLRRYMLDHQIDAVVLFGQSRQVHAVVPEIASNLGVRLFVFEEGYERPHHVTLEIDGVNAHSPLPRERAFYDAIPADVLPALRRPVPTGQSFWRTARCAAAYGLAKAVTGWLHPHAVYHRPLNPLVESLRWLRGGGRKLRNWLPDRAVMQQLAAPQRSGRWFLFPLQVHNDSQILQHSQYPGMEAGIDEVMASFAAHADADDWLVIKHHPMDRAYRDFTRHIRAQAARLGISARVRYVHDLHLPTLLTHTRGMVTVNSTTGLQALHHGKPVITLGDCVYAVDGLVYGGTLDRFWAEPGRVDLQLFYRFRHHLLQQSQLNASFYAGAPALAAPAAGAVAGAVAVAGLGTTVAPRRLSVPGPQTPAPATAMPMRAPAALAAATVLQAARAPLMAAHITTPARTLPASSPPRAAGRGHPPRAASVRATHSRRRGARVGSEALQSH